MFDDMISRALFGQGDSDALVTSLFGIACTMKPRLVLELGVREGVSTLPLLWATSLSGGLMLSVDIRQTPFTPPQDLAESWKFLEYDALEFLEEFRKSNPDTSFDIVFIDDWHAYDHVKKELELIAPLVTKDSLILLHDCMVGTMRGNAQYQQDRPTPAQNPEFAEGGPARAVLELDRNEWEWSTIPVSNGLTILRKL